MSRYFLPILFLFSSLTLKSQERKIYKITYTEETPKIDAELNESIWNQSQIASDFTQTLPSPDNPSEFETEVKLVYNNKALYVGAKMFQKRSEGSKMLTARDVTRNINADIFTLFLDTYDDHQNGFAFSVSSAGVQQDERLSEGVQQGDENWDAVWHSKVKIYENFWMVEMEIPFSAIRFTPSDSMKWGINFGRVQRKKNENSFWNKINVQQSGFLAQTALLEGLHIVKPPVRLFLYPYLSTGYSENPFNNPTSKQWLKSGGLDLKYGLSESFTLDLTLVPDFSQVISDNLIRNLSPFEQQLSENRPFFTEGVDLFGKADLFYSRRIGARPKGYFDIEDSYGDSSKFSIDKNPNVSILYNAFKISGRTKNNTGIGIFNSLVKPMCATVTDNITREKINVNTSPLTNYNIIAIDKPLKGQSNLHFANTNVMRNGNERDANVSALLYTLYDKKEMHVLSGYGKSSIIHDNAYNIGTSLGLNYAKVSGKFRYTLSASRMSPLFDKTDMGLQYDYNLSTQNIYLSYNDNKPKQKYLQLYNVNTSHSFSWNTVPIAFRQYEVNANLFLLFKNFWDLSFGLNSKPIAPIDYYQLGDFGKKLKNFPYLFSYVNGSSDSRKKWYWSFYGGYGFSNSKHSDYLETSQEIRYQFSNKFEVAISGRYTRDRSNIGFSFYDDKLETPVVGRRNVIEYEGQLSMKYNFSPIMNFNARFRHYNSFITYRSFHTVDESGEWRGNNYPYQNGYNENFNLQNIDIFFNWIFKPGSRVVLSYKQWIGDAYILNEKLNQKYFDNVYQIIKSPHAFEFSARVIFFIDYNNLKG